MNWYIGQKIVAVGNHAGGRFKKGDVFTIKMIRGSFCKCCKVLINVGETESNHSWCKKCNSKNESDVVWYSEKCFAPIAPSQELSTHTTETLIEELEEQLQTV